MKQAIISFVFIIALSIGEFLCYTVLRKAGFPVSSAIVVTFFSCLGIFALFAGIFLFRPASFPDGEGWEREPTVAPARRDASRSSASRLTAFDESRYDEYSGEAPISALEWKPASTEPDSPQPGQLPQHTPVPADEFDPIRDAMEKRLDEFSELLTDSARELTRFDLSVLRTLERNAPGSVEGVVTTMKIHAAIEQRLQTMIQVLEHPGVIPPEVGNPLLQADLVTPNDDHLSSLFSLTPLPPIPISEVGYHMRVLLKRIARRRSIFRGVKQDLLLVGSARHTLVGQTESTTDEANIRLPWEKNILSDAQAQLTAQDDDAPSFDGPVGEELEEAPGSSIDLETAIVELDTVGDAHHAPFGPSVVHEASAPSSPDDADVAASAGDEIGAEALAAGENESSTQLSGEEPPAEEPSGDLEHANGSGAADEAAPIEPDIPLVPLDAEVQLAENSPGDSASSPLAEAAEEKQP